MYIGIDLGTSGVKVILTDDQQKILATKVEPLTIQRPQLLWSEQNPHDWWVATNNAMLQLKRQFDLQNVKAIGLSGQMHGATLLDKHHKVLRPAILWNDGRSTVECQELEKLVPNSQQVTGNLMMTGFTAPKLKWLQKNEPTLFQNIDKVILPKDYIRFCMTGYFASDMSDASGTMWLDVGKRSWNKGLLSACGLTETQMPTLYEGTEITGSLLSSIAQHWGMHTVPVVAGGGDNAAGALGVGLYQQGQAMLSLGTSGVYFVVTNSFLSNPKQAVHSFCHVVPNTWHLMSVMLSAASSLDWAVKVLNITNVGELLSRVEQTKQTSNNVYFLPYLSGERTPYNNAHAKGMFFGLTHHHTTTDLARAVVEGVSFALANCMDVLHQTGISPSRIYLIGGGARSQYWNQLLSNITGYSLIYSEGGNVGPALGAAKLAQIAMYPTRAIDEILQPPVILQTYEPDMLQHDYFKPRRDIFSKLYKHISPMLQKELL